MIEFDFDGLAVIDPDYDSPFNPNYTDNLRELVSICQKLGKPVFVSNNGRRIQDLEIKQILVGAYNIPVGTQDIWNKLLAEGHTKQKIRNNFSQKSVDFIAQVIEKIPGEIRLGFGGIYAIGCVYECARSWCAKVDTNHDIIFEFNSCKIPLRYGQVIDYIV